MPRLFPILLCVAVTLGCLAEEAKKAAPLEAPQPLAYESLRAWHEAGGLSGYHWPEEHKLDLNGDGKDEIFLAVAGYGRGMSYALFTRTGKQWVLLSEAIDGSHHEPSLLPEKHEGWHDFAALHPTGRGGLREVVYTWSGKAYVEKSNREITEKELFPERKDSIRTSK